MEDPDDIFRARATISVIRGCSLKMKTIIQVHSKMLQRNVSNVNKFEYLICLLTDKHFFLQQKAQSNEIKIKSVSRTACKTTNSEKNQIKLPFMLS